MIIGGVVFKVTKIRDSENEQTKTCLYVPSSMRAEIMYNMHDEHVSGGHFGLKKTYDKMQKRYYWPGMENSLREYIKSCEVCQKGKKPRRKPYGLLSPIHIEKPWRMVRN